MSHLNPMKVRAEMARRGLAPNQLFPYWSPDTERTIDPLRDTTDGRQAVREFAYWLWRECISVEKGEQ